MSELTEKQRNQSFLDFQQWFVKYVHDKSDDWTLTARVAFYAGWDAATQGKLLRTICSYLEKGREQRERRHKL